MPNRIKEFMERDGLQPKDIQLYCHVSQATVSRWITNMSDPKKENLKAVTELFKVAPSELIYYAPPADLEPAQDWNPQYPDGVALRRDMSGFKSESRPAPQGLTMDDIAKIAEYVTNAKDTAAPKTPEARIVSFGMDNLPKETREMILGMVRGMFTNKPEARYFEDKKGDKE